MAESAVSFLLNQLAVLIKDERKRFGGLHSKVVYIEGQLRMMQAFLRVADAKEDSDPQLKEWVTQVRELAYDIEDVLDMFMYRFGHLRNRANGFLGRFKKTYAAMKNYDARRDVALQLTEMESRVKTMYEQHLGYQSRYRDEQNVSSSYVVDYKFDVLGDARLVEENMLVGIEGPKQELTDQLFGDASQLKAIAVVGMGGVGKSTLVNTVYKDEDVKRRFTCHAWVNVSQAYNIEELLKKLIQHLYAEHNEPLPKNMESLDGNDLKMRVKDFLRERSYIIVLDGVWNTSSWNDLRQALPQSNTSSRVLLSTRKFSVANATRVEYRGYVYEMKTLSFRESWALFRKKTFEDEICPPHLEDVAKRILAKCGGLPLAILAIGGMLASKNKDAISDWEMVYNNLLNEIGDDGELGRVKKVILLSYYDLHYYLKSCLLYISILPEDFTIDHENIIQLWIAEGLVQESGNMTREEVGVCYINELIHRNLVQEKEMTIRNIRRNRFGMHDIVREVIVDKSSEQNFVNTQSGKDSRLPTKVRRLANHGFADTIRETSNLKHLRSMVLIGSTNSMHERCINILATGGCKLLKVLYLENAPLEKIPNDVFKLYLLTYLNLYATKVKVIPKSIGKLVYLETLNLAETDVIHIPIQILKLQRLRHLYAFKYILRRDHLSGTYHVQSFSAPYRIGRLSSLNSLMYIDADQMGDTSIVREIGKLTQLETLGVCKLRREDGKDLCFSLEKLSRLHSLRIISITNDEIIDLDHPLSSIPRFLKEVCLEGRLEKVPHWIPSLRELTKVKLESSKLSHDPLEFLEELPNLGTLSLTDAFDGTTLHFKAEKFSSLRTLAFQHLGRLTSIVVDKDSIPNLVELQIRYCKQMLELPIGLDHLAKLQEFKVWDMNDKFVEAFENGKTSNEKLAHISMAVWNNDQGNWKYL